MCNYFIAIFCQALCKNPEISQRKLTRSFNGSDSAKLLPQENIKKGIDCVKHCYVFHSLLILVDPGKILETKYNAGTRKPPLKRSVRISEKSSLVRTPSSSKKMPPPMIKNQKNDILATKTRTPSPRKSLRKQLFHKQVC